MLRLIVHLPHRMRLKVGFAIGRLGHRMLASRRAVTRKNIALCFPELSADKRDELALAHFEALGASVIEMGIGRWSSDEELQQLTRIEGLEHINEPASKGVGVIILSAHFTTLEMSGRVLSMNIPPFDAVYRKNRNPLFTEILRTSREVSARGTIEKNDIKSMVRSLRSGTPVWYAPDQSYRGKQSALLPFFGVPAMTNTATGTLGRLGNAVAVPFFPRRLDDGTYVVSILPALTDFPDKDAVRDTEKYTDQLEKQIRLCPEQYYWVHKKFKNCPPPDDAVYSDLDALK